MSSNLFQPGNELWKLRPFNSGPARMITDPKELFDGFVAYFQWCQDNPIEEEVVGWFQGEATTHTVHKMRATTIRGAMAHMGLDWQLWYDWRNSREDLKPVILWAENIMYEQKFTGAAAGVLNPGIIARELGLAEKTDHTSSDGSMTPKPNVIEFLSPEVVSEAIAGAMAEENPEGT